MTNTIQFDKFYNHHVKATVSNNDKYCAVNHKRKIQIYNSDGNIMFEIDFPNETNTFQQAIAFNNASNMLATKIGNSLYFFILNDSTWSHSHNVVIDEDIIIKGIKERDCVNDMSFNFSDDLLLLKNGFKNNDTSIEIFDMKSNTIVFSKKLNVGVGDIYKYMSYYASAQFNPSRNELVYGSMCSGINFCEVNSDYSLTNINNFCSTLEYPTKTRNVVMSFCYNKTGDKSACTTYDGEIFVFVYNCTKWSIFFMIETSVCNLYVSSFDRHDGVLMVGKRYGFLVVDLKNQQVTQIKLTNWVDTLVCSKNIDKIFFTAEFNSTHVKWLDLCDLEKEGAICNTKQIHIC